LSFAGPRQRWADADPETGYLVYGASVGGLNEYGGTSFVAPQLNRSTAVIVSYLGHRVRFWNPGHRPRRGERLQAQ
jgi:hypothetical protein